jgi:hypothetical protein
LTFTQNKWRSPPAPAKILRVSVSTGVDATGSLHESFQPHLKGLAYRSITHQQTIRCEECCNPGCVCLAEQLAFSRTKRVRGVHDFLQILLLCKNGEGKAAIISKTTADIVAFIVPPYIDETAMSLPTNEFAPDISHSAAA